MEIWKDIKGFEGLYQISDLGNVKSLNYKRTKTEKILIPKKHNKGYLQVQLKNKDTNKTFTIHRLVAETFIPNPNNYPCVNHKDENKQNNNVGNLEWVTYKGNNDYSKLLHPERYRQKIENEKYKRRLNNKVNQFDLKGNLIRVWDNSRTIFVETGMSDWSISECCRGNRKTAYGYIWQYANNHISVGEKQL